MINEQFDSRYINLLASKKVEESGKVSFGKLSGFIKTIFQLLNELIFHRPRLCYLALTSTGFAFYRDVILVSLLKLFGVKRIYHMHNKGVSRFQDHPIHRFFYRFVFKSTDVILLSQHLYPDIEHFVPKENIFVLPNGIPDVSGEADHKPQKHIVNILFLSNLIESKGVFILLEAIALLNKNGTTYRGTFIGGEGDITKEQFEQKVKYLGLQNHVQYMGKRYGQEKELAFLEADIFAFPTYYSNETFGLVNLEAMQHSLPVISTFEGGIPDIVDDGVTGFLVPQKDVQALANKLEYLILNPEVRKLMGEAGLKKFKENYTLEIFENNLVNILKKELKKTHALKKL